MVPGTFPQGVLHRIDVELLVPAPSDAAATVKAENKGKKEKRRRDGGKGETHTKSELGSLSGNGTMLRNVIIVTTSGIVIFSKEFIKSDIKPSLLGAIVTAMVDFSIQRTGMAVSYIEMSSLGVAVSYNTVAKVICIVDVEDGPEFTKLIAGEILVAFSSTFMNQLEERINLFDKFSPFNSKIGEVIRQSVRPVLENLSNQKGILLALLTSGSGDSVIYSVQDVDKISILAPHSRLLDLANDIMGNQSDAPASIEMRNEKTTLCLFRIIRSSFIVVFKNNVNSKGESCKRGIDEAAVLIRKLLVMASNLTGDVR